MSALLEIRGLSAWYGAQRVVDGVDVDAQPGTFCSLVGESGSGKSTTALAICRLVSARLDGKIFFGEGSSRRDLLALSSSELREVRGRRIAYVFQDPATSLNPVLRVGPQVDEAFTTHRLGGTAEARKRTLETFDSLRLSDPERAYASFPHELSGGMRQRAMIAMALVAGPSLLVADEPTSALDVTTAAEILSLLDRLRRERGLAILFITHDLPLAARYSDEIRVLRAGRLEERLTRGADGFHPKSDYARKLFRSDLSQWPPKTSVPA